MAKFGVNVINENYQTFTILAGQTYQSPGQFLVEGDASSASYFLAAAAIKGGEIKVTGIGKTAFKVIFNLQTLWKKWVRKLNGARIMYFVVKGS